jgi:hypothetical protein
MKILLTQKNKKYKRKNTLRGGYAFDAGGFGCAFKEPALKCKNKERQKNSITKVLTNKHAKEEYYDTVKFRPLLTKIPNYAKYFLIDNITMCELEPFTKQDLENFDDECDHPLKGIKSYEINSNLDKVKGITMPFGGINVHRFFEKITKNGSLNYEMVLQLNKSLIDLLKNGILPMNKVSIYHRDLKAGNVLIVVDRNKNILTRIIDWGMSGVFNILQDQSIPDRFLNGSMQFNNPFSNIIFSEEFELMYSDFLVQNPSPPENLIQSFVINYLNMFFTRYGIGHLENMNMIFLTSFIEDIILGSDLSQSNKEILLKQDYVLYYVTIYITEILVKYTRADNKLYIFQYFKEVFIPNLDLWGFVMVFSPLLRIFTRKKFLSNTERNISKALTDMFTYLIKCSVTVVDVQVIIRKIESINEYCILDTNSKSISNMKQIEPQRQFSLTNAIVSNVQNNKTNFKRTLTVIKNMLIKKSLSAPNVKNGGTTRKKKMALKKIK